MKKIIYLLALLFFSLSLFAQENNPLLFGNPSEAKAEVSSSSNYLLVKDEYILSYNNSTLCPNWVSWHLEQEDIGEAGRSNKFLPDNTLPDQWYHVTAQDYQFSAYGFDRGHVCPSADRTSTSSSNSITFLMTNMIPQSPNCNRIVWMHMESFERSLAAQGNEVYIFAGPAGTGGEGNRGIFEEILTMTKNGECFKIRVPEYCWKIMVVLPAGEDDLSRVQNGQAKIIAACIPNTQSCNVDSDGNKIDWQHYLCSVDYIEEITGFDFLDLLPDELEEKLEKEVWNYE